MADPRPSSTIPPPPLPLVRKLVVQRCPAAKHRLRPSLNPATSTRRKGRGGGSFLFCRNYFPGRASCLIFRPASAATSSPPNLFNSRPRVWHEEREQYPCSLRGRAQECFLPSASCRLSSFSLSLRFFERESGGWLASSSSSPSPRVSNASRSREKFEETASRKRRWLCNALAFYVSSRFPSWWVYCWARAWKVAEFRLLILLLLLSVQAQLFFELANPIRISSSNFGSMDGWQPSRMVGE